MVSRQAPACPEGRDADDRSSATDWWRAPEGARAQAVGGARGRLGRCSDAAMNAAPLSSVDTSGRTAGEGAGAFAGLPRADRCWHIAQSGEWTATQSFPVLDSTCEYARALAALRSSCAS